MPDRQVHAKLSTGAEVVRYDRAGKWYVENAPGGPRRRRILISEAVWLATGRGAKVFLQLPGGEAFDRLVKKTKENHA